MSSHLILRADAGSSMGVGHVMRCLALAQAWQDQGGRATFVCAELPVPLADRLRREGCDVDFLQLIAREVEDAAATIRIAREKGAEWIVVDGYGFSAAYYQQLRDNGYSVLALDDMQHLAHYPVDVLLNQNLSAQPSLYANRVAADAELLLGPRYSLLRREFRQAMPRRPSVSGATRRVLLSFGGGDAENFTGRLLRQLAHGRDHNVEVKVLAGAANPHVAGLRSLIPTLPFRTQLTVNIENVAAAMAWADVAITAGGSTVWEMACMRLPALIGAIEDNQLAGLAALGAVPFFHAMLAHELVQCDLVAEIDVLLQRVAATEPGELAASFPFDANGATRVVDVLTRRPIALT
jgi:UDP-2,4-diacetamido-2,4,6-trideoxy-beta-L-altropyranose hydrolase